MEVKVPKEEMEDATNLQLTHSNNLGRGDPSGPQPRPLRLSELTRGQRIHPSVSPPLAVLAQEAL